MPEELRQLLADKLLDVQRTLGWMDLVIGSIEDGVCVVDCRGNIIFANEYFAQLVDLQKIYLLGMAMKDVIILKQVDAPLSEYREFQNTLSGMDTQSSGVFEWTNKQGELQTFKVTTRLLPNSDQSVFFMQNITHAYQLTVMKNNFINLASHQLRTPMTAIMTYAHMLSSGFAGTLKEDQQTYAETIVRSSERMIHLVDGLLKITRVQSNQENFVKESVSIGAVVEQLLAELQPQIHEKNLICDLKIPAHLPVIQNDASVIHEVLSNLVVNAIQYTRKTGKITIKACLKEEVVCISVTDTGIGIPKEHQPLMFNQFSRADNALKEFSEGTGLGLFLVKILLEKIGGSISLKSKLNVGTTFTVTLPLVSEY